MKYAKTIIFGLISAICLAYINIFSPEYLLIPLINSQGGVSNILLIWIYHVSKILFFFFLGYETKNNDVIIKKEYIPYDEVLYPQIKKIDNHLKPFKDQE